MSWPANARAMVLVSRRFPACVAQRQPRPPLSGRSGCGLRLTLLLPLCYRSRPLRGAEVACLLRGVEWVQLWCWNSLWESREKSSFKCRYRLYLGLRKVFSIKMLMKEQTETPNSAQSCPLPPPHPTPVRPSLHLLTFLCFFCWVSVELTSCGPGF